MYLSRVIREECAGAGRRRCILEVPAGKNVYIVKAIYRCSKENEAQDLFDFLIKLKEPKAYTLAAPAASPKRGKRKKEADDA